MKIFRLFPVLLGVMLAFAACSDSSDSPVDLTPIEPVPDQVDTINVDVILPLDIQRQWQNTIDWALENITAAQHIQKHQVYLRLRYHDEDAVDFDNLGYALTHPKKGEDTCHAIIGPYHSDNAQAILNYAQSKRLPVVMPTCTSAELQRINARNTYAWFFTESDITQTEMMMTTCQFVGVKAVSLIYTDDTYGRSFYDWMPFFATEHSLKIVGGSAVYKKGVDLRDYLTGVAREFREAYPDIEADRIEDDNTDVVLVVALSDATGYKDVLDQLASITTDLAEDYGVVFIPMLSDTSFSEDVLESLKGATCLGVTPTASNVMGFTATYKSRFGKIPSYGAAQVYDALTLIALGAAYQVASPNECIIDDMPVVYNERPFEAGLTDYMRSVVASWDGPNTTWDKAGLATAFKYLFQNKPVHVSGATGTLDFDDLYNTSILQTTYELWVMNDEVIPLAYLSTGGSSTETSTTQIWQQKKQYEQEIGQDAITSWLPERDECWAVVVSPSTTWANYRHQADAFAMYQTLRQHGYDDDHIVLIVEDNLASNPRNAKFDGKIFVERETQIVTYDPLVNEDVRAGCVVDYHFSDLQPEDLADILLGRESERLPHVIHSDGDDNVFFFWSGHGGALEGPLWGNENSTVYFGTERIKNIVQEMADESQFRRMMLAIETCFSGKWGEALTDIPNVIVLTAANPYETSKADMHSAELGVYLSNAFARTFRRQINTNFEITIYNLYKELAKTTNGSHVSMYNQQNYGNVYTELVNDFFSEE